MKESCSRRRTRSTLLVDPVPGSSQYDIFASIGIDNSNPAKLRKCNRTKIKTNDMIILSDNDSAFDEDLSPVHNSVGKKTKKTRAKLRNCTKSRKKLHDIISFKKNESNSDEEASPVHNSVGNNMKVENLRKMMDWIGNRMICLRNAFNRCQNKLNMISKDEAKLLLCVVGLHEIQPHLVSIVI